MSSNISINKEIEEYISLNVKEDITLVLMVVCGSGKTTIGKKLAEFN